jgi:hypothetical protein
MKNRFKHKFSEKIVTAIQFKAQKCDFDPLLGGDGKVSIKRVKDNDYTVTITDQLNGGVFNITHNDWVIQGGFFNFVIIPGNYFDDLFEKYVPSVREIGNYFDTLFKTWLYIERFDGTTPKFIELFNVDVTINSINTDRCTLTYGDRTIELRKGDYWAWDGKHYNFIDDIHFRLKPRSY